MVNLQKDSIDFLKYYIYRDSDDELKFIEEQRLRNLKIFINIYHSDYIPLEKEKKWLTVHTKLKESKIEEMKMVDEAVLMRKNAEYSVSSNFFYIKSQQLSHRIKKIIAKPNQSVNITTVETVITKHNSKCETVVITSVFNDDCGKMKKNQRWFTREIFECHNHFTDKHEASANKSNTKKDVTANKKSDHRSSKHSDSKRSASSRPTSMIKQDSVIKESPVTNLNSHLTILKKMKSPKRSFKNKLGNFFNRFVSPSTNEPSSISPTIRRVSQPIISKQYSTESRQMEKEKPTNIIAHISRLKEDESKTFEIITDDIEYMDEEENEEKYIYLYNRHSNYITDASHFNFQQSNFGRKRNDSFFTASACNCDKKRYECMAKCIVLGIQKKRADIEEFSNYDEITRHFKDCTEYLTPSPNSLSLPLTSSPRVRRGSVISVDSEIYLDRIFENLKTTNQVDCPVENIVYFMNAISYDEYKNGMSKVLDPEINLENLLLFFYSTRSIIKQIDDPNFKNEKIKKILDFSKNYLIEKYFVEIQRFGDLEGFIKHCVINANEEVD